MKSLHTAISLILISTNCANNATDDPLKEKIRGVIFDGPAQPPITKEMVENVQSSNAKWVATTPEAFIYKNTLRVKSFLSTDQWYGETIEGSLKVVSFAKQFGLKVMLKPHIALSWDFSGWSEYENIDLRLEADRKKIEKYISTLENKAKGSWRGDFEIKNPEDWAIWESEYEKFILDCAQLADSAQIELFCAGTELDNVAIQRTSFWRRLIKKIRSIYKGQVTYCANWNNYQKIKFWDELDYIGISAYFPVSEKQSPSVDDALNGWKPHLVEIENFQKKYSKPVLFAELGFKSTEYAGIKPWMEYTNHTVNFDAQANLYEATFRNFWRKEWFKGIFIWKWYYAGNGGLTSYSPQSKPALEIIKHWYQKD